MATWDEIKALASDFKRAQEITSVNKLSERNCIDIINFLLTDNLIKLHFTVDGKSILTPDELVKEIYEELEVQNHRVSLNSLSNTLDIDTRIIETCVHGMIVKDDELQLINNELLDASYVRMISLQINDILKEKCNINIVELTQKFNLPIMFLEKIIVSNQFGIIQAVKEGDLIFTEAFIRRFTSTIRGYLTKSTKPICIYSFIDKQILSEKIIKKVITDAIKIGRLNGTYDSVNVTFTPSIFIQNQKDTIGKFYERNGYIEFTTIVKFGITHTSKYIESNFPNALQLSNCAIGDILLTQIEEALNEVIVNKNLVDCYQIIPFPINSKDLDKLIAKLVKNSKNYNDAQLLDCGYFVHKQFIQKCFQLLEPEINKRAQAYAKQHRKTLVTIFTEESFNKNQLDDQIDEVNESKSSGGKVKKVKYGGGERGREMKNKSVKNKYMIDKKKKSNSNQDETSSNSDMFEACFQESEAVDMLVDKLQSQNSCSHELMEEIYGLIERQLSAKFKSECQSIVLQTSDTAKNKVEHQKLELKVTTLLNKLKIFIKGIDEIDDENETNELLKKDLKKYHFKSIATDLVNLLFEFVAIDQQLEFNQSTSTNETRNKFISQLKSNIVSHMKNLNKTIKESENFDDFFNHFETICNQLGIYPKTVDKKTEKRIILEISAEYHLKVLEKSDDKFKMDPAELLLVTLLLLYNKIMGLPINASGKFVPVLLPFLEQKSELTKLDWSLLRKYQDYIVALVKFQGSVEDKESFKLQNQQLHESVFEIALNWKGLS